MTTHDQYNESNPLIIKFGAVRGVEWRGRFYWFNESDWRSVLERFIDNRWIDTFKEVPAPICRRYVGAIVNNCPKHYMDPKIKACDTCGVDDVLLRLAAAAADKE